MTLRTSTRLALYLLAAAALLWPFLVNADYIFFQDTSAYLRYPAQAFRIIFGIETDWSDMFPSPTGAAEAGNAVGMATGTATNEAPDKTVAAGRSIYYGAMLYTGALLGGLWFGILVQFGCVVLAVHMTLVSLFGAHHRSFPVVMALLGVATPLSFFISYLMPDLFAGIAILAIANLFAFEDELPLWKRGLWLALLMAALMFHTSHMAIALLVAPAAAAVAWVALRRPPWRAGTAVTLAVCAAFLAEILFFQAVEMIYGAPPLRPPFLMARIISDGPGYTYLAAQCPEIGLRVCDFLPRLPLDTDTFLWSQDPQIGIYGIADAATRRAFDAEQLGFVISVLAFDPLGQLAASFDGFLEQLRRFGLREFAYTASLRDITLETLPAAERANFVQSALYRETFPLRTADAVVHLAVVASAAYLLWWAISAMLGRNWSVAMQEEDGRPFLVFAVILIGGVIANAAVTGILSTPHERYQARVIWLIPLLAMIVFLRRSPRTPSATEWRASTS